MFYKWKCKKCDPVPCYFFIDVPPDDNGPRFCPIDNERVIWEPVEKEKTQKEIEDEWFQDR